MKVGSKSLLFGVHCFFIHPWFVALAWWRLYGFPWDPRLWVAFFVHDLGYWGKPNMDGPEGQTHPELGGRIMGWLFDFHWYTLRGRIYKLCYGRVWRACNTLHFRSKLSWDWEYFTKNHSRNYAGANFSKLCVADKLAIAITPWWIYLPLAIASGEIKEYMADTKKLHPKNCPNDVIWFELQSDRKRLWLRGLQYYMREWVKDNNKFVSINT